MKWRERKCPTSKLKQGGFELWLSGLQVWHSTAESQGHPLGHYTFNKLPHGQAGRCSHARHPEYAAMHDTQGVEPADRQRTDSRQTHSYIVGIDFS